MKKFLVYLSLAVAIFFGYTVYNDPNMQPHLAAAGEQIQSGDYADIGRRAVTSVAEAAIEAVN